MCNCPLSAFSPLSPLVLAELQQDGLISSEECEGLYDPNHVVAVMRGKSSELQAKISDVLRRHGFEDGSNLLAGEQTQLLIHVPVVCCAVEPSFKATGRPEWGFQAT